MGKVEQHENTVNHGVAQGDEGIKTSPLQGINEVLHEKIKGHAVLSPINISTQWPGFTRPPLCGQ